MIQDLSVPWILYELCDRFLWARLGSLAVSARSLIMDIRDLKMERQEVINIAVHKLDLCVTMAFFSSHT